MSTLKQVTIFHNKYSRQSKDFIKNNVPVPIPDHITIVDVYGGNNPLSGMISMNEHIENGGNSQIGTFPSVLVMTPKYYDVENNKNIEEGSKFFEAPSSLTEINQFIIQNNEKALENPIKTEVEISGINQKEVEQQTPSVLTDIENAAKLFEDAGNQILISN